MLVINDTIYCCIQRELGNKMGKMKAFLTRHSYWMSAVSFVGVIFGIVGTVWAMWNTPTAGKIYLKHEMYTDRELIFSATNSGGSVTALNKIELDFSKPIQFTHLNKTLVSIYKDKVISKEYQIKRVIRYPHVPIDFPAIDSNNTLYISNASGHLDISPINNSCNSLSGNLPCLVEPHSQITIRIGLHGHGEQSLSIGRNSSKYDLLAFFKDEGNLRLCVFFEDNQKSCIKGSIDEMSPL